MTDPLPAIQKLIDVHASLEWLVSKEDGANVTRRVKCSQSGHEMPAVVEIIERYVASKKYKKITQWYTYDFSRYEPFIIQHRRKPHSLYCNVTETVINRIPEEVERHVNGKKFKRMKKDVTSIKDPKDKKRAEDLENEVEDDFDAEQFEFANSEVIESEEDEADDDIDEEPLYSEEAQGSESEPEQEAHLSKKKRKLDHRRS